MALVHRLLTAGPAWSTHHRVALDALTQLRSAAGWPRLFWRHAFRYLAGTAAPDDDFGDFKNHVLCVREGNWGGAPAAARAWYLRTVYALRDQLWPEAAFSAGVLCHYVTDPLMPLHSGQSEAAGAVHYGIDLAIERTYGRLKHLLMTKLGGYPDVETPNSKDWLERVIRHGAEQAHTSYELLIDHCEPNLLLHYPNEGMDDDACTAVAKLLGLATVSCARVLDRAIAESGVAAPKVRLFGFGVGLALRAPWAWLTGPLARGGKRRVLQELVREYQSTGKVVQHLPLSEREVRQLHAVEVRRITLEQLDAETIRPVGSKHPRILASGAAKVDSKVEAFATAAPKTVPSATDREPSKSTRAVERPQPPEPLRADKPVRPAPLAFSALADPMPPAAAPRPQPPAKPVPPPPLPKAPDPEPTILKLRFNLGMSSPVASAPGITPQLAEQLVEMGIDNVGDLLTADPKVVVDELQHATLTADQVIDWQAAAALACQLPEIRGHDVLLLVAAGVHDPRQLSRFAPKELLDRLQPALKASDSNDLIRLDPPPTLRDVSQWIELAKKARPLSAAS